MNHIYKIRIGSFFFLFLLYYVLIILRLYVVQIHQHHFFTNKKSTQYHKTHISFPPRALIYDTHNQPLALNSTYTSIFIEPSMVQQSESIHTFLKKYFPEAALKYALNPRAPFLFIKRHLNKNDLIIIKTAPLKEIHCIEEPARFYPDTSLTHLIGITDIDNKGLFGIEKIYNAQLAGTPTTSILEKDARSGNYYFNKITHTQGKNGEPIQLTIDRTIQHIAHTRLLETVEKWHAQEGMVVIVNPENGDILACAQYPFCEPQTITADTIAHTNNKICTQSYELGSVVKVFSALAALDEGVVTLDEPIDCLNMKEGDIHGYHISTWKAHGILPFSEVIAVSNNFGIATVAHRLGKKLYTHYQRLGFGQKTSLQWPGEQSGFINPPHKWTGQSIISLSFGYEITMTLAQLAQAFCIIASHGIKKNIRLIKNKLSEETRVYKSESIDAIRALLEKAVNTGTGKHAALPQSFITKDYKIFGKTGTANMVIDGAYNTKHNTYVFAGIVEKKYSEDNMNEKKVYKRVVITFIKEIENNTRIYASSVTAPLFQKIIEDMILYEKQF